jgi:hypothetical protein
VVALLAAQCRGQMATMLTFESAFGFREMGS